MRATLAMLAAALTALLVACGGSADALDVTPTPEVSAAPTEAPTDTPEPSPTATPEEWLAARYIAHTGGDGVSLRDACADDARVPGAWAEGTKVRILDGSDDCAGWHYVAGPDAESWVRADYLSADRPAGAPATGGSAGSSGGGSSSSGGGGATSGSGTPMFVFGTAKPGVFVAVFAGGQFCGSAIADAAIGLWGIDAGGPGSCPAHNGDPLTFTVNGNWVAAPGSPTFAAGGQVSVDLPK